MVHHEMMSIIQRSKNFLKFITNAQDFEIERLDCWILSDYNTASFLILIKGIVPSYLFNFIHKFFPTMTLALAACSSFMHFVFEETQTIWTDRCDIQSNFEKAANISLANKKENFVSLGYNFLTSIPLNNQYSDPISAMIQLRSHWTNFWCSSGQALFFSFSLWFFSKVIFLT
jgi:hypothetical protein